MGIYSSYDINIKKSYLLMLIKIEEADKKIDVHEEAFISFMAGKLGLTDKDIRDIRQNPEKFEFRLPDNIDDRLRIFYSLLYMMGIDGEIKKSEKEMCRKLGFRLCINPVLMDDLIDIMVENLNKRLPEDQMLEAVKKYLN
jgi:uncharacterized tellurite resistance protein B-like protein